MAKNERCSGGWWASWPSPVPGKLRRYLMRGGRTERQDLGKANGAREIIGLGKYRREAQSALVAGMPGVGLALGIPIAADLAERDDGSGDDNGIAVSAVIGCRNHTTHAVEQKRKGNQRGKTKPQK